MSKQPCAYILASGHYGTLYVGVTSDLLARLYQHRSGAVHGFTKRYSVHRLVRYELLADMPTAIAREAVEGVASRLEDQFDRVG